MLRIPVLFILTFSVFGQTPADLYAIEEYRAWLAKQPAATQVSPDVLDDYKAYLIERGADSVDAESQLRVIKAQAGRPEPDALPFLAEMVKGRKPGKALEVSKGHADGALWLASHGWDATGIDVSKSNASPFSKGRWDLIVIRKVPFQEHVPEIIRALRPGGMLIIEGMGRGEAVTGLRLVKRVEAAGLYCGEKAR